MKQALALGVVVLSVFGALYYFFMPSDAPEVVAPAVDVVEIAQGVSKPTFDFSYVPPDGWRLWEGVSANLSTFANTKGVYDPYDVELMQAYLNQWSPSETDVLVYVRSETVGATNRDYMQAVAVANEQAENPLLYDDVRMVLYDKPLDLTVESSETEIHARAVIDVAGVSADYFRVKSPPEHDSINLSLPYNGKTISLYKSVPKELTDAQVQDMLRPFVEQIPFE